MTYFIIFVLLGFAAVAVYWLQSNGRADPVTLSARLGRYGFLTSRGNEIFAIPRSTVKQRSEQRAISRSVESMVGTGKFGQALANRLERADLRWTPGEYMMMCVAVFLVACLVGIVAKGILGCLALGIVGIAAPRFYTGKRYKTRQRKFQGQLADMAQMMGNSMRAGFSIIQSMEMVAQEGPSPAKEEFERVTTEIKLGLPLDTALDHLLVRMPSEDLELAIVAINVQRQVGGNLAEILMVISKTVRERVRFQRDLKAMTAQARYSSYVITALPVGVAFVINLMDRPYESYLYTSTLGHLMIGAAVAMLGAGYFFLKRIANIEV